MVFPTKIALAIACLASVLSPISGQCSLQTATPKFRRAVFDFSSNLIKRVAEEQADHFVFSPLSIWTLLAVAAEGAGGATREELFQVLRLNNQPCFKSKFYELIRSLSLQNEEVTAQRSGLIVPDLSLQVKEEFIQIVKTQLGVANVLPLDLTSSEDAASDINEYIATQTDGNIEDVIAAEDLNDIVLLLIDTVYFKGKWRFQFDSEETKESAFYNEQGMEIGQVNVMTLRNGRFNLTDVAILGARVLELPYGSDGRYSMLVFLPNYGVQLADVIENLKKITLMSIFKKFELHGPVPVDVSLPRFKITSELHGLKDLLLDLGIKLIFDEGQADLSRISDLSTYVSKVIQKADIEVTEEGTTASAASVAFVSFRSQPDLFDAEKPFLYLIVERNTQSVLFAGAYSTPSLY